VEFTLSIPGALDLISEFSVRGRAAARRPNTHTELHWRPLASLVMRMRHQAKPGLYVGVGTVLSTQDAEAGVRAGAHFVVCPALCLSVVKWCAARNVCCMAGVYSPTEMWECYKVSQAQCTDSLPCVGFQS
jgi:hypothetical protein